jgi:predicted transcriptional regulator
MADLKLFDAEFKIMNIIWELEPINSTKLTQVCAERLGWKKPTTYTVIRKLADRGVLKNEDAIVTSLVQQELVQKYEADTLLQKAFNGSIPTFIAAFLDGKTLTEEDTDALMKMIKGAKK